MILDHFKHIELTQDQKEALLQIDAFLSGQEQIFILQGYAGTGKTTLLKGIADYLNSSNKMFQLFAPTGRAAKVLRDKTGEGKTIHSGIYNFEKLESKNSTSTILADHSFEYFFPINFTNANEQVIIVDEASMISSRESKNELFSFGTDILLDDLLSFSFNSNKHNKLIFVGDPMQLPPVGDNQSKALNKEILQELGYQCTLAKLTTVKRQENNLILANAMKLRNTFKADPRNELTFEYDETSFTELSTDDVIDTYTANYPKPEIGDGVIISYSNSQSYHYNFAIREKLFPQDKNITPGDLILINNNNYHTYGVALYNGDIAKVIDVVDSTSKQSAPVWIIKNGKKIQQTITIEFREIVIRIPGYPNDIPCMIIEDLLNSIDRDLTLDMKKALYINFVMRFQDEQIKKKNSGLESHSVGSKEFKDQLKSDRYFNALKIKYGYAITCHKAQGGEWDKVFVDYSGRIGLYNDALRWMYTATTRASQKLFAINPPHFTTFSKLKFSKIGTIGKLPAEALDFSGVNTSPFHSANMHKGKSLKYWQVKETLEQDNFLIKNVQTNEYLERYTVSDHEGNLYQVEASHRESGHFVNQFKLTKSSNSEQNNNLLDSFNQPLAFNHSINYNPSTEALKNLYSNVREACTNLDITITNIVEQVEKYHVIYYFITDSVCAYIQFYFKGNGTFSTAVPKTFQCTDDKKLISLIEQLQKDAV